MSRNALQAAAYVLLMLASIGAFRNATLMHPDWTYPYFSAAEHLDSFTHPRCSVEGYREFRELPQRQMFLYDFGKEKGHELRECSYNDIGYVYVVYAARHLFPFLSSINAAVALQCLTHIVLTLVVAFSFRRPLHRALFVLLYGANPLIIHFVTFAFPYYWQVVPASALVLLMRESNRTIAFFVVMYAALFFSYLVRPSVLPLVAFVALFAFFNAPARARIPHAIMALALASAIAAAWQPKQPWHTMYVGIGAYDNPYMTGLSDGNAYLLYKKEKNIDVTAGVFDSTFYNAKTREDYYQTMKKHYLEILRNDFALVSRNAALNLAQSFSVGYFVKYPQLRLPSMLLGLLVFALLLYTRQYLLTLAILASSIGFVLYFPPIPAYMFGSYLLLAYGAVRALETSAPGEPGTKRRARTKQD